jgi:hypothetical protein
MHVMLTSSWIAGALYLAVVWSWSSLNVNFSAQVLRRQRELANYPSGVVKKPCNNGDAPPLPPKPCKPTKGLAIISRYMCRRLVSNKRNSPWLVTTGRSWFSGRCERIFLEKNHLNHSNRCIYGYLYMYIKGILTIFSHKFSAKYPTQSADSSDSFPKSVSCFCVRIQSLVELWHSEDSDNICFRLMN